MAREDRQDKRKARKDAKVAKVESTVDKQISGIAQSVDKAIANTKQAPPAAASSFSYDIKHPDNWDKMTAGQQNTWSEQNKDGILAGNFAQKLDELGKSYKPTLEKVPAIDRNKLIELETKRKKRKWMDIVSGVMTGLQGGTVDVSQLPTHRLQAQKDQILQNYKGATLRNQKALDVWKRKEYDTRMEWLEKAHSKAKTPEEKEMYTAEMNQANDSLSLRQKEFSLKEKEFTAREKGGYYNKTKPTTKTTKPATTNYMEMLSGLSDNPEQLFPDPGDKRYSPQEKEQMAMQLIHQMYTFEKDEQGNMVPTPIPGKENYLTERSEGIQSAKLDTKIKEAEANVTLFQQDYDNARNKDKATKKQALDAAIEELNKLEKQRTAPKENITPVNKEVADFFN